MTTKEQAQKALDALKRISMRAQHDCNSLSKIAAVQEDSKIIEAALQSHLTAQTVEDAEVRAAIAHAEIIISSRKRQGCYDTVKTLKTLIHAATTAKQDDIAERLAGVQITRYTIPHPIYLDGIRIEFNGVDRWAVRKGSQCLNKDGSWSYEPLPSSRDDDFLDKHRFASPKEALAAYEARKGGG